MYTFSYPIEIVEVLNGFIITVGDKTVVVEGVRSFDDAIAKLVRVLNGYLHDRGSAEQEWDKRFPVEERAEVRKMEACDDRWRFSKK